MKETGDPLREPVFILFCFYKAMKNTQSLFKNSFFATISISVSLLVVLSGNANASEEMTIVPNMTAETVIALTNQDRVAAGLMPLSEQQTLMRAAQEKANDMVASSYFAHTSPSGKTPWYWIERNGYSYRYAGENLAIRFQDAQTQEDAWMKSVKHRENILNPKYHDIGVAVRQTMQDGKPVIITVQMFGLLSGAAIPEQKPFVSGVQTNTDAALSQLSEQSAITTIPEKGSDSFAQEKLISITKEGVILFAGYITIGGIIITGIGAMALYERTRMKEKDSFS